MNKSKITEIEEPAECKEATPNTVTIAELATLLGISKATIYSRIYNGTMDLPYIKMGKMVRFLVSDVRLWLEGKRKESISESLYANYGVIPSLELVKKGGCSCKTQEK